MQVATASDIELVSASALQYRSPRFSPDGAYIYYLAGDPGALANSAYRVAAIGGTPRKVIADASTTPTLSPDGTMMAFARLDVNALTLATAIVLANADGAGERVLIPAGEKFGHGEFEWSDDGRELVLVREDGVGKPSTLVAVSVADGRERSLTKTSWEMAIQPVWLTRGRGVLILAQAKNEASQIWHVGLPSGETRRLTDSVTGYSTFSVALEGDAFVASVQDTESSLWIGRPGQASSWQRIEGGADRLDGLGGVAWTHDGQLLYGARVDGRPDIMIMRPDGSDRRRLTFDGDARGPSVSPDGRVVAYARNQAGRSNLWRMNLDGTDVRKLTDLEFAGSAAWTPDGATLIFLARLGNRFGVYRIPAGGGAAPTLVTDQLFNRATVSPDGKWLAAMAMAADQRLVAAVAPYPAGAPWRPLGISAVPVMGVEWAPDGTIVFVKREGSSSNLWQVSMDGRAPTRLTAFDNADARRWAWSRDGRLASVRSRDTWDVFLMSGLNGILPRR
jgi:Tol biopolymer transport system component